MKIQYFEPETGRGEIPEAWKESMEEAARTVLAWELYGQLDEEAKKEVRELPILISLTSVTKDEIRELNRDYRGVDKVTDVLSFPQYSDLEEFSDALDEVEEEDRLLPLGDVVICYEKTIEQAREYGTTVERETIYLLVHSLLHLLGYDHMEEADKKRMRDHEETILWSLGLGHDLGTIREEDLLGIARHAMSKAYAPYSGYAVGAALLAGNGKVYTGVNIENASYGATICAERTALAKAVSDGAHRFIALAITADGKAPVPCGICRQVLSEFAPDLYIIVAGKDPSAHAEETEHYRLTELLPSPF